MSVQPFVAIRSTITEPNRASIKRYTFHPLDTCYKPLDTRSLLDTSLTLDPDSCVERIKKGDLQRLFSDVDIIEAVATVLRISSRAVPSSPGENGRGFCCVLPGHEEEHPSAHLYRNDKGAYVYVCFHDRDEFHVRTLPEAYLRSAQAQPDSCAVLSMPSGVFGCWLRLESYPQST